MIDSSAILKSIRKERNLTIQAVSEGTGIAVRTYQNYEYGKREISADALCKLADFYDVSTDYLLGRTVNTDIDIIELVSKVADFTELEKSFFTLYISYNREERTEFLKNTMLKFRKVVVDTEKNKNE